MSAVLILNLPYIINKNLNQVLALKNYHFLFITKEKKIQDNQCPENCEQKPIKNPLARLFFCFFFLLKNRRKIHHVEIYPGGKLTIIFLILVKSFGCKNVIIERGDIHYAGIKSDKLPFFGKYDTFTCISIKLSYRFASSIWYKERAFLNYDLNRYNSNLYYLPNAIDIEDINIEDLNRDIVFLWLNRLHKERYSKWFIDALKKMDAKSYLVGLLGNKFNLEEEYVVKNKPDCLTLFKFKDPREYYIKAKFFVFPAKVVFGNHALFEAMSYGCVPIVTDAQDIKKLILDGVNGFICEFNPESFYLTLKKALEMTNEVYNQMSKNARKTVVDHFSLANLREKKLDLYQSL